MERGVYHTVKRLYGDGYFKDLLGVKRPILCSLCYMLGLLMHTFILREGGGVHLGRGGTLREGGGGTLTEGAGFLRILESWNYFGILVYLFKGLEMFWNLGQFKKEVLEKFWKSMCLYKRHV